MVLTLCPRPFPCQVAAVHTAAVAVPTGAAVLMVGAVPMVAAAPTEVDTVRGEPTVVRLGTALRKQQCHFFNFQITPISPFYQAMAEGAPMVVHACACVDLCLEWVVVFFISRLRRRLFVIPIVVLNRLRRRRSVWR